MLRPQAITEGVVADFLAWSKDYAADLRTDIAPAALRDKFERLNLMNDAATISSSTGRALEAAQSRRARPTTATLPHPASSTRSGYNIDVSDAPQARCTLLRYLRLSEI